MTLPAASPSAIAQGGELRLDETWDLMRDTYGYEVDRITKVITIEEEGSGTNVIDTQGLRPLVRRQEGPVVHELRFPRRQDGGALAC